MCTWEEKTLCRVPIPENLSHDGKFRWDYKPIDNCLVGIINALNAGGIYTAQSCCGHGKSMPMIILHDGRQIIINT